MRIMRRLNKKIPEKFWYLQDGGTYTFQIPVFIGYTIPEIGAILRKQKSFNKEAVKSFLDEIEDATEKLHGKQGGIWSTQTGWSLMYLPEWKGTWNDIETLVHECFHLTINQLGRHRLFINHSTSTIEEEAMAYCQEYLWKSIRKRLSNHFKK